MVSEESDQVMEDGKAAVGIRDRVEVELELLEEGCRSQLAGDCQLRRDACGGGRRNFKRAGECKFSPGRAPLPFNFFPQAANFKTP